VLSLSEVYRDLSDEELKERQDFLLENTVRSRARSTTPEVWERMGVDLETLRPYLRAAAAKQDLNQFIAFQRGFFSTLVPNVRRLGLLDANNGYLRQKWDEFGLLQFEFADDTGSEYENYDEVAKDRVVGATAGAS